MSENLSTGNTEGSPESEAHMGTGTADSAANAVYVTAEQLLAGHKVTASVQLAARLLNMAQAIAAVRGVSANQIINELLAKGVCELIEDPQFRHLAERYVEEAAPSPDTPQRRVVLGAEAHGATPAADHHDHSGIEDTY